MRFFKAGINRRRKQSALPLGEFLFFTKVAIIAAALPSLFWCGKTDRSAARRKIGANVPWLTVDAKRPLRASILKPSRRIFSNKVEEDASLECNNYC